MTEPSNASSGLRDYRVRRQHESGSGSGGPADDDCDTDSLHEEHEPSPPRVAQPRNWYDDAGASLPDGMGTVSLYEGSDTVDIDGVGTHDPPAAYISDDTFHPPIPSPPPSTESPCNRNRRPSPPVVPPVQSAQSEQPFVFPESDYDQPFASPVEDSQTVTTFYIPLRIRQQVRTESMEGYHHVTDVSFFVKVFCIMQRMSENRFSFGMHGVPSIEAATIIAEHQQNMSKDHSPRYQKALNNWQSTFHRYPLDEITDEDTEVLCSDDVTVEQLHTIFDGEGPLPLVKAALHDANKSPGLVILWGRLRTAEKSIKLGHLLADSMMYLLAAGSIQERRVAAFARLVDLALESIPEVENAKDPDKAEEIRRGKAEKKVIDRAVGFGLCLRKTEIAVDLILDTAPFSDCLIPNQARTVLRSLVNEICSDITEYHDMHVVADTMMTGYLSYAAVFAANKPSGKSMGCEPEIGPIIAQPVQHMRRKRQAITNYRNRQLIQVTLQLLAAPTSVGSLDKRRSDAIDSKYSAILTSQSVRLVRFTVKSAPFLSGHIGDCATRVSPAIREILEGPSFGIAERPPLIARLAPNGDVVPDGYQACHFLQFLTAASPPRVLRQLLLRAKLEPVQLNYLRSLANLAACVLVLTMDYYGHVPSGIRASINELRSLGPKHTVLLPKTQDPRFNIVSASLASLFAIATGGTRRFSLVRILSQFYNAQNALCFGSVNDDTDCGNGGSGLLYSSLDLKATSNALSFLTLPGMPGSAKSYTAGETHKNIPPGMVISLCTQTAAATRTEDRVATARFTDEPEEDRSWSELKTVGTEASLSSSKMVLVKSAQGEQWLSRKTSSFYGGADVMCTNLIKMLSEMPPSVQQRFNNLCGCLLFSNDQSPVSISTIVASIHDLEKPGITEDTRRAARYQIHCGMAITAMLAQVRPAWDTTGRSAIEMDMLLRTYQGHFTDIMRRMGIQSPNDRTLSVRINEALANASVASSELPIMHAVIRGLLSGVELENITLSGERLRYIVAAASRLANSPGFLQYNISRAFVNAHGSGDPKETLLYALGDRGALPDMEISRLLVGLAHCLAAVQYNIAHLRNIATFTELISTLIEQLNRYQQHRFRGTPVDSSPADSDGEEAANSPFPDNVSADTQPQLPRFTRVDMAHTVLFAVCSFPLDATVQDREKFANGIVKQLDQIYELSLHSTHRPQPISVTTVVNESRGILTEERCDQFRSQATNANIEQIISLLKTTLVDMEQARDTTRQHLTAWKANLRRTSRMIVSTPLTQPHFQPKLILPLTTLTGAKGMYTFVGERSRILEDGNPCKAFPVSTAAVGIPRPPGARTHTVVTVLRDKDVRGAIIDEFLQSANVVGKFPQQHFLPPVTITEENHQAMRRLEINILHRFSHEIALLFIEQPKQVAYKISQLFGAKSSTDMDKAARRSYADMDNDPNNPTNVDSGNDSRIKSTMIGAQDVLRAIDCALKEDADWVTTGNMRTDAALRIITVTINSMLMTHGSKAFEFITVILSHFLHEHCKVANTDPELFDPLAGYMPMDCEAPGQETLVQRTPLDTEAFAMKGGFQMKSLFMHIGALMSNTPRMAALYSSVAMQREGYDISQVVPSKHGVPYLDMLTKMPNYGFAPSLLTNAEIGTKVMVDTDLGTGISEAANVPVSVTAMCHVHVETSAVVKMTYRSVENVSNFNVSHRIDPDTNPKITTHPFDGLLQLVRLLTENARMVPTTRREGVRLIRRALAWMPEGDRPYANASFVLYNENIKIDPEAPLPTEQDYVDLRDGCIEFSFTVLVNDLVAAMEIFQSAMDEVLGNPKSIGEIAHAVRAILRRCEFDTCSAENHHAGMYFHQSRSAESLGTSGGLDGIPSLMVALHHGVGPAFLAELVKFAANEYLERLGLLNPDNGTAMGVGLTNDARELAQMVLSWSISHIATPSDAEFLAVRVPVAATEIPVPTLANYVADHDRMKVAMPDVAFLTIVQPDRFLHGQTPGVDQPMDSVSLLITRALNLLQDVRSTERQTDIFGKEHAINSKQLFEAVCENHIATKRSILFTLATELVRSLNANGDAVVLNNLQKLRHRNTITSEINELRGNRETFVHGNTRSMGHRSFHVTLDICSDSGVATRRQLYGSDINVSSSELRDIQYIEAYDKLAKTARNCGITEPGSVWQDTDSKHVMAPSVSSSWREPCKPVLGLQKHIDSLRCVARGYDAFTKFTTVAIRTFDDMMQQNADYLTEFGGQRKRSRADADADMVQDPDQPVAKRRFVRPLEEPTSAENPSLGQDCAVSVPVFSWIEQDAHEHRRKMSELFLKVRMTKDAAAANQGGYDRPIMPVRPIPQGAMPDRRFDRGGVVHSGVTGLPNAVTSVRRVVDRVGNSATVNPQTGQFFSGTRRAPGLDNDGPAAAAAPLNIPREDAEHNIAPASTAVRAAVSGARPMDVVQSAGQPTVLSAVPMALSNAARVSEPDMSIFTTRRPTQRRQDALRHWSAVGANRQRNDDGSGVGNAESREAANTQREEEGHVEQELVSTSSLDGVDFNQANGSVPRD